MKLQSIAPVVLAASLAGCATDKPLIQTVSEGFNSARASVANAIAPSASAPTATTTATTVTAAPVAKAEEKKGPGVTWGNEDCAKKLGDTSVIKSAVRSAKGQFTSPNAECVYVAINDSAKGSKIASVTYAGLINAENCSPTMAGTASVVGSAITGRLTNILGQVAGGALPGAAGNVVRTQSSRAAVASATDTKNQIRSGGSTLTAEQQAACKVDLTTVSADVKSAATQWLADYKKENKGAKPVVTYSGTGDLKDLQLGVAPR